MSKETKPKKVDFAALEASKAEKAKLINSKKIVTKNGTTDTGKPQG